MKPLVGGIMSEEWFAWRVALRIFSPHLYHVWQLKVQFAVSANVFGFWGPLYCPKWPGMCLMVLVFWSSRTCRENCSEQTQQRQRRCKAASKILRWLWISKLVNVCMYTVYIITHMYILFLELNTEADRMQQGNSTFLQDFPTKTELIGQIAGPWWMGLVGDGFDTLPAVQDL
jgi:predicted nucleic acid-binding Zn ribbon protein